MVENFLKLCRGLPDGRGYEGSKLFRAKPNDHVLGGDFENNDGTGGASAYDEKYLIAEQVTIGETEDSFVLLQIFYLSFFLSIWEIPKLPKL